MNNQEPELELVPFETEQQATDHEKLMLAYQKLNIQLDEAIAKIRQRRQGAA